MALLSARSLLGTGVFFAALLLAAGCDQPGGEKPSADAGDVELGLESEAEPAYQPLPAKPVLRETEPGTYVWGDPDHDDSRRVQVLFENGTEGNLRVELAADVALAVPPLQRASLYTHVGAVRFRTSDRELSDAESFEVAANDDDLWIYNHRSAWDYFFRKIHYSTIPELGGREGSEILVGPVLFRAGHIDYLFEPAPESVTVMTFGSFGTATKTELRHMSEEPVSGRSPRRIAGKDREEFCVVTDEFGEAVHVHPLGASAHDGRTAVRVDNAWPEGSGALTIEFHGEKLAEVQPGDLLTLNLPARPLQLAARTAAGELLESQAFEADGGGRYVWCQGGRRKYTIDFKEYSISSFGLPGVNLKGPPQVSCRGLRFFRCNVPLMFVRFPVTYTLPEHQFQARVGRVSQGVADDFQPVLAGEWDRLRDSARRELSPELYRQFERETAPADAERLSDCDLWLAEGWVESARGDDEAALVSFGRLLQFQPDLALAYKLSGLSAARLGRYADALGDLRAAISRDQGLAAELEPKIQEMERLREQQSAETGAETESDEP